MLKSILIALCYVYICFLSIGIARAATSLPFAVNMTEAVTVDTTGGTPRIAIDVGGVTRYASYASGSGTSTLTFTYEAVTGDVDLDGIAVSSPVQLNGGTMKDAAGNDATLTFSIPTTTGVKVNYPSLSMDFINGATGRYTFNGTAYTSLASFLSAVGGTFGRASTATYFDSTGTLQNAASGVPRLDHNPVTLAAKGILIEESRTNYVQNSQFSGITTGGPYTGATTLGGHWQTLGAGGFPSSSITITGTGTANGIPYLDLRFQGTNSTGGVGYITFNTITADKFSVVTGDKTIASAWMAVTSYTSTGGSATAVFQARSYTGAGAYAGGSQISYNATSPWQKVVTPVLTHGATGVTSDGWIFLSIPNAVTVDITVRLGGMQVEKAGFATSYIPTTNGIATRLADSLSMPTGTWFDAARGTMALTSTNGVSSATVGIASLDNSASSANDRITLIRIAPTTIEGRVGTGGVTQYYGASTVLGDGMTNKTALAFEVNDFRMAANNTLMALDTGGSIPPINRLRLGVWGGSAFYSGWISDFKYYPLRVADTQLQLLTQ